jgi:Surface antigen variable number repeat
MILTLLLLALIDFASTASLEHPPLQTPEQTVVKCTQPENEQEPLLREAIENRFTVRRVEFVGNETTRDNILRKRIFLQEGELFTRRNLSRSIANVSKLRIIYPVKISDVIVRLDRPDKLIDLAFCFRERHPRRSKRAARRFAAGERGIAPFSTGFVRRG